MRPGFGDGAAAGCAATIPMSAVMGLFHHFLPASQRYSYPPTEITEHAAHKLGVPARIESPAHKVFAFVSHLGYGAAMGVLYARLMNRPRRHPLVKGIAYGMGVWAGSYIGLLPAAGLYPPAAEKPLGRNLMMIAAHVVWGAVLGLAIEKDSFRLSPRRRTAPKSAVPLRRSSLRA